MGPKGQSTPNREWLLVTKEPRNQRAQKPKISGLCGPCSNHGELHTYYGFFKGPLSFWKRHGNRHDCHPEESPERLLPTGSGYIPAGLDWAEWPDLDETNPRVGPIHTPCPRGPSYSAMTGLELRNHEWNGFSRPFVPFVIT